VTEQAGYTDPEGQKSRDPMSSTATNKDAFAWTKQWYPVMLVSDLDAQNPTPHTLLNISMVVWQDGEGNWGACEDRCPHRSAATQLPCGHVGFTFALYTSPFYLASKLGCLA